MCKRLVEGEICPACKSNDLTKNWKGLLIVIDPDSELAREAGIVAPGKYAVKVR
jgi:DNA-directed RNA polymerase subunit E"